MSWIADREVSAEGGGRRPQIPQTTIISLESQFSNTPAPETTCRLLATGKAARGAQRGPGARAESTGTNFRNREKLSREDAPGACGSLGSSRRGPSTSRALESSGPAPPGRPGPRPRAPQGKRTDRRALSPSARLGSPRPHEESYLRRAGRAQEDSRGPKPTAAALSPSRPTPRRKWAALRPRPWPAPRPRPPPRRPGAVSSSRHLPPARYSGSLPPLPGFPWLRGEPPVKRAWRRRAKTPKRTSCSPHFTPELPHLLPLVGAQAGSDPSRGRRSGDSWNSPRAGDCRIMNEIDFSIGL
ncbi:translation initiation factor IF-2-like [Pteropus medius]|uniref:translation initiation factor IF-2-like n=1 Tax=Pteropus vampyrus TaxID=132908 RepID=UPI00196BA3C5|nr:translation initiation factor IF-2-like [Pteropus giganteus]